MIKASMTGVAVSSLALVAVAGATVGVSILRMQPQPTPVEKTVLTLTPVISQSSSDANNQGLATSTAENELGLLLPSPRSGDEPVLDVARIEPSGDVVIAGRAAPGASVELLRSGEIHDRVVADRSRGSS